MDLLPFLVIAIFLIVVLFCVGGVILYNFEREHQKDDTVYYYRENITIGECENYYYENGTVSILGNGELINFGDEEI